MNPTTHKSPSDDAESELVALLVGSPSARVAVVSTLEMNKTSLLRSALDNSLARGRFGERRFFLSCNDASSSEALWSLLASVLGLETPDSDDTDLAIAVVLDELTVYNNTLVTLDRLESLYSGSPVQQEATDVLLAALATIDGVTLLVSFSGHSLPECVPWSLVNDHVAALVVLAADMSNPVSGTIEPPSPPPPFADSDTLSFTHKTTDAMDFDAINTVPEIQDAEGPPGPPTLASSRRLPPQPTVFHGRDKELNWLVQQILVPNSAPVGIVGPGGIGKTTLALKVLHHPSTRESFSTRRFFVSCEDATSPDDVLARLAYKIDAKLPQGIPMWEAVITTLRSNKRTFLLIDNFESIWSAIDKVMREAAEVFLAQLAVLEEVTILVTTRGNQLPEDFSWANATTAELDTLSSTAARRVFCDLTCLKPEILAAEPENTALTQLLKEVDFVPLAITLLSRLDDLPSSLLREWLEYFTEVLEADRHDGTRRELSVQVSIKISLAHLPPETVENRPRQLLAVCSQLPAGLFVELSNHLRFSIPSIDAAAENLLRHSLVYAGNLGELRMLSPVRHHVSHNLPMDDTAQFWVEEFYLRVASRIPQPERVLIDRPAYDREIPNILAILTSMADRPSEILIRAVEGLTRYGMCHGRRIPFKLPEKVLLHVGDHPLWMAICLDLLGSLHLDAGDDDKASCYFETAAKHFDKIGDKKRVAFSRVGMFAAEKSLESMKATGPDMRQSLSDAGRSDVADYITHLGLEPSVAIEPLRSARETHIQSGNLFIAVMSSRVLAKAKKELGDVIGSIQEYKTTITLCEQVLPESHPLALAKLNLAELYLRQRDLVAAEDLLGEAYAIFSEQECKPNLARAIGLIAKLRAGQYRPREAAENFEEAARKYHEFGDVENADICIHNAGVARRRLQAFTSLMQGS